ncbi:MAG TPA: hypothetical protein VK808_09080 [Bacteroidia bacterium]|jgi:hypothetical protein|nr:hypothetical protein [Bacteroidia bacterium]
MKSALTAKWAFVILPLLYVVLSVIFLGGIRQFYISHSDPPYCYLMNGVNLASWHCRVGILEHPGTPVEIFAAIVIFIKHLFASDGLLYQDVLIHPESYLYTCSIVLVVFLAAVTFFSGVYIFRYTGNVALAMLFQLAPLFFGDIIKMTVSLSTESFIVIFGIPFIAYLYIHTICKNQKGENTTNKNVLIFGLFTALLFTTKIYCLPIFILILFLLKNNRQRAIYTGSFGMFSMLLLFPLYNQFKNWLGWIKSAILHTGSYGQGSSGIINTGLYKSNIIEILTTHNLFALVYSLIIAAFITALWMRLKRKADSNNLIFPIMGILISFTLFILIIAKQYKFNYPEPLTHTVITITKYYYFIPLIICFPLFLTIVFEILSSLFNARFIQLCKSKAIYIALLISIILGSQKTYAVCSEAGQQKVDLYKTTQFLDSWKHTPLIIVTDGDKVCVEPALFLGISYAGKWDSPQYLDFVKKTYPNTYLYATWNDGLLFWDEGTNLSNILNKKNQALLYFSGSDSATEATIIRKICAAPSEKTRMESRKIYTSDNRYETIYLIADTLR